MARIIDGKKIAEAVRADVRAQTAELAARGLKPGLAVILVGDDPASHVYVRNKEKAALEAGFHSLVQRLPADTTQEALLAQIAALNDDPAIHGFLVQLPLPKHIDEERVLNAVSPLKDVDGFHPENAGRLFVGAPRFVPATPAGVMEMLKREGIDTAGKRAVVVGRSNIVGKPMAALLLAKGADATVTVCHSRTRNLQEVTREADILVAAIGQPRFITAAHVKPGAVVIDVGTSRVDGKLVGDVDFDAVKEIASAITPVPGGVGPMTITMLLVNTLKAARLQAGI